MKHPEVRRAFLAGELTSNEALLKLRPYVFWATVDEALIESWDLIKGLQAELKATREQRRTPHLAFGIAADLIDLALTVGHITPTEAIKYLAMEGMLEHVARTHVATIVSIKNKDAERDEYLADPDNAPRYCTRCGRATTAAELSLRSLCHVCSSEATIACVYELKTRQGPYYRKWRDGMLRTMALWEDEMIKERREEETLTLDDLNDHDKAPPCWGDCDHCIILDCRHRDDPYYPTDTKHEKEPWKCSICGHFNKHNAHQCSDCGANNPYSD